MRWVRLAVCAGSGLLVAGSGYAQSRSGKMVPWIMIANPYTSVATDSLAAVEIGKGMRQQAADYVGDDYRVVPDSVMNEALTQFGYPADAILNPTSAIDLAKHINARIAVTGTLAKAGSDQYQVTTRLAGVNDEAGDVMSVSRQPSEQLSDFGRRIADSLHDAIKALGDAKECFDQLESRPDKATKAAEKALKRVPNHGLAQLCLYRLALQQKAPPEEQLKHLEALVQGDPQSFVGWRALANAYLAVNDTAKVLMAAQRLLQLAPTDHELRTNIIRYLLDAKRVQLALDVTNEGLKLDSSKAEYYKFKSDACLYLRNLPCAMDALQALYSADSTKADTAFFTKLLAVTQEARDTADLVQWARVAVRKYPQDVEFLQALHRAYFWTNQVDSTVEVARQIIRLDTAGPEPALVALAAVQQLAQGQRIGEATPFIEFIEQHGPPPQRNRLAGILLPLAVVRLQGDSTAGVAPDLQGSVELARRAAELADSSSPVFENAAYVLGLGLFSQATKMDSLTEAQKSCDMARQEQQLLVEARAQLTKVRSTGTNQTRVQQYLEFIDKFDPRVAAMLKAYCP